MSDPSMRARAAERAAVDAVLDAARAGDGRALVLPQWVAHTRAELRAGDQVEPRRVRYSQVLTPQQHQIAALVAGGATNREIAAKLYLSHRTVEHHLRNIFTRLGIRSRTELASLLA
jgi:DNA-binding NarL/FixJ family response regulator